VIAILVVSLAVRLVAAFSNDLPPQTDARDYDRAAASIASGDGFPGATVFSGGPGPSAFRPPAYPFLLSGVYALTGTTHSTDRWQAGRILQAIIGVGIVALTMLIALQLLGRRETLIAGVIAAIYPPLIFVGTTLLTEPFFILLTLAGVAAILRYRRDDTRISWLVLAGLCAGLATLTRTNGVIAIIVLALGAWTLRPRFSLQALSRPALVVLVAVAAIAPWTIRNAVVLHSFVPVSTQTGFALAGQYNDVAADDRATWLPAFVVPRYCPLFFRTPRCVASPRKPPEPRGLGEVALGKRLTDLSRDFALDHPGHVISAAFWNGLRLFDLENPFNGERRDAFYLGEPSDLVAPSIYSFWLLALLTIAGCFTAAARRIPFFIWLIPLLLMLAVIFVDAMARYRAPAEPIFILVAACAIAAGWRSLRARTGATTDPA
jgi:4-amino-4-deoxy-L-arabinose transferase-like glycosyltransferase